MLVFGKNVLFDIDEKKIRKAYVSSNQNKSSAIVQYLENKHIRYEKIPIQKMNHMVYGNHQGIILDIDDYEYSSLEQCFSESFVLILDHLEDPHNLGAIIRSAEAAGIKYIILPKDRSVRVNETVMKVSAGALDRISVILVNNIAEAIQTLQKHDFFVYAAVMNGQDYRNVSYAPKKVLVIGNEGKGIHQLVQKKSDELISIPMNGKINSLNASVAAGILIFYMMGDA